MEFLTGNPFSTPVGHRIECATSSSLQSEDWALNMDICDIINSTEEGPKDAVKAIRKRIVGNKNFREVMLSLTVLEACVKNCGHRFHILVSTRDFIEGVLVRAIIPKNNPPLVLHDRVLSIIQAWADAFRSSPDLTGVVSVYEDLRRKGLEFPMTELDGYFPIHTPNKVKKLKADLAVVQSNLTVMSDMMSQLDPVMATHTDVELLEQLYTVCKEMQDRMVKIVPALSDEKFIEQLLATNDEMHTTFTRYQRFERQMANGQSTTQKSPTYVNLTDLNLATKSVNQPVAAVPISSYLSQSTVDTVSNQMARLSTSEADNLDKRNISQTQQRQKCEQSEVAVDGLAQAQNTRLQNTETCVSPASNRSSSPKLDWMIKKGMIPVSQSTVMDDIEKWLAMDEEDDDFGDSDGVTSEEFDRFLAARAKAAERLPSLKASSQDANHSQS